MYIVLHEIATYMYIQTMSNLLRHQLNRSQSVVSQSPLLRGWQKFAAQTFVGGSIASISSMIAKDKHKSLRLYFVNFIDKNFDTMQASIITGT